MRLLVNLSLDELVTRRRALSRYRLDERARMRRVQAGKIKRTRASEQAMVLADIEMLRTRIHKLIESGGKGGLDANAVDHEA